MTKKIVRNIIIDKPTNEDLFDGKGHERTAVSLAQMIQEFDGKDRAIGLDGPWGSGKSSVVEIAEQHLENARKQKDVRHRFFTFDIWKSQGAGFRRSFLEHFVTWAQERFPEKRPELEEIEKGIHGRTQEIETNNRPILGWFGIIVLVLLPFLPIYYFWAKNSLDEFWSRDIPEGAGVIDKIFDFLGLPPVIFLILFVLSTFLVAGKKFKDGKGDIDFTSALSSVLLISSKQHQDHKVTQKVREIDPNDYEFHRTLREILGIIQSPDVKVVMVLDNIDRLPKKEIKDYWALVRSIFSRTHQSTSVEPEKTITAIVPYARNLIEVNVSDEGEDEQNTESQCITKLSSRELFSKTFDEVLSVSPPVLSNAREFFTEKLKYALPKQVSKDDGFRAYRIFCELLRNEGGTTTPRQVVSFVNDLSGLYVLHEGRFPLPTVAAYLAHQGMITSDPSKLNDEANLDSKIVKLASDQELPRHLAAMVFNVDAELAFQVLLDDVIARAAVADSPDELERLSRSSGFDLRVDDVVKSNLDEWCSTGDYRAAIENFARVLPSYGGDAKPHIAAALVEGFEMIEGFEISQEEYVPYLTLFDIAEKTDRPKLLRRYLQSAFAGIDALEEAAYETGQEFAEFLSYSKEHLEALDLGETLREELGHHTPNPSADFLFGLGVSIADSGFEFADFKNVKITLPEDKDFFEDMATAKPALAKLALAQFKRAGLLSNDSWVAVANACLSTCKDEEKGPEDVADLLGVVCFSWRSLPEKRRGEIALSETLSEGQFFRNLGSGETEPSERAIANAFFLTGQTGLGQKLGDPRKLHPNGQQRVPDVSDEFTTFGDLILGESSLTEEQAIIISTKAKQAIKVADPWIEFGQENRDHQAVEQVVRQVFSFDDPPHLTLHGLTSYFEYLQDLLGNAEYIDVLKRFDTRIDTEQISKINLKSVPKEFLTATHHAGGEGWQKFHEHVDTEFKAIDSTDWSAHIEEMDHTAQLLVEKLSTSGCSLDSAKFREPLIRVTLDVLSGMAAPSAEEGAIDILMSALDDSFRADIWRTIREKITDVTPESLENALHLFPKLLSEFVQRGDRIMAHEKDNVVRHVLCPALEGRNRAALDIFIGMGYKRISDFKKSSNGSTIKRLDGAMKSFSESEEDRAWIRTVGEAVLGKKRTKTIWDVWFGTREEAG
ncbi:P-loop NTPase fold protein [Roseobacteraceae bacterium NS-SX3]